MHLSEHIVRDKVVLKEQNVSTQNVLHDEAAIGRGVVARKLRTTSGLSIVFNAAFQLLRCVDRFFGLLESPRTQVRRVDLGALVKSLLKKNDGRCVHLLSGRAPAVPNLEHRIGPENGNNKRSKRLIEAWV